jgi:hypothetical protein
MPEFFTSAVFKYFLVPLATVFLNVFVKVSSRNDRFSSFSKEDVSVGLQIAMTAIILFIANSVAISQKISSASNPSSPEVIALQKQLMVSPWIIFFLVLLLWGVSTLVRKFGWESKDSQTWFVGVILPFIYGVITLAFVVTWIGG